MAALTVWWFRILSLINPSLKPYNFFPEVVFWGFWLEPLKKRDVGRGMDEAP